MITKILKKQQGFTLIEVLIVVALLAILAVVALVAINPAQAQKKSRDVQRLKEVGDLQKIVEQFIIDNGNPAAAITATSNATGKDGTCGTATGWLTFDACPYANTVVRDPVNGAGLYVLGTNGTEAATNGTVNYRVNIDTSGRYRICAHMESKANYTRLNGDGVANNFFEVYNNTAAAGCGTD